MSKLTKVLLLAILVVTTLTTVNCEDVADEAAEQQPEVEATIGDETPSATPAKAAKAALSFSDQELDPSKPVSRQKEATSGGERLQEDDNDAGKISNPNESTNTTRLSPEVMRRLVDKVMRAMQSNTRNGQSNNIANDQSNNIGPNNGGRRAFNGFGQQPPPPSPPPPPPQQQNVGQRQGPPNVQGNGQMNGNGMRTLVRSAMGQMQQQGQRNNAAFGQQRQPNVNGPQMANGFNG